MARMTHKQAVDVALEAMAWAVEHFKLMDQANACMHCAPVRYSPVTMRLAKGYEALAQSTGNDLTEAVMGVLGHEGAYELDPGR
jgi:hypothetical protein